MPLIQVKDIEGVLTIDQKAELIERLTDAAVAVLGESLRSIVWVVFDDVKSGDWGIGGKPLTTADVRALMALQTGPEEERR